MLVFERMGLCVRDSKPLPAAISPFQRVEGNILSTCGWSYGRRASLLKVAAVGGCAWTGGKTGITGFELHAFGESQEADVVAKAVCRDTGEGTQALGSD